MSHLLQRKQHHEAACEQALQAGDAAVAVGHAARAADYALALARAVGTGPVAERHLADAEEWLAIAEKIRVSAPRLKRDRSPSPKTGSAAAEPNTAPTDSTFLVTEKPSVTFDSIAGMAGAKESIRRMVILPLRRPELTRSLGLRAGGGVLLYGPPGNGKTLLGKAIAGELDAAFFYASGAQIRSKWHGESEQRLRSLLQAAKNEPVAVLFLDEVDGLLPRRGGNSAVDNRIVTQFLAEVGGFEDSPNTLLILGATNKPWDIDEAVFRTGRFDEKIYIPPPDREAREAILRMHLDPVPTDPAIDPAAWADRLHRHTGSDIVGIVNAAKRHALARALDTDTDTEPRLLPPDLETALTTIPPSINERMLAQFTRFAEQAHAST